MTTATVAGALLIVLPLAFNVAFALLAARFDYPDILRRPTSEVLERFRAGGASLVLLWWVFAVTAVLLAPLAVLVAFALPGATGSLLACGMTIGVLAALVQALGLVRWPFLVPYLARADAQPDCTPTRRDTIDLIFQSANRYLGVAVGEHLGYALTGAWTVLIGAAALQSTATPDWLGVAGIVSGATLALCSLEFVGPNERAGWRLAAAVTPIAYVAWSVWLVALGVGADRVTHGRIVLGPVSAE